jgi:hypothetical protein
LELRDDEESKYGHLGGGFPVVGLRVRLFWPRYRRSFLATVKNWNEEDGKWELRYDDWVDDVLEDVPVVDWEFV